MALILAVEPDRQQAAQLTTIVRHRVGAELVLAETTEGALVAIGDRVPDLVLIPTLLSPQDDAALAGALRVIATAARVQMLTIPVLGESTRPPRRLGVLARWRRGRSASPSPDGCDPAVFAEQIAAYLAEAAAERAAEVAAERAVERAAESIEEISATEIPPEDPTLVIVEAVTGRPLEPAMTSVIEERWTPPIDEPVVPAIDDILTIETLQSIQESQASEEHDTFAVAPPADPAEQTPTDVPIAQGIDQLSVQPIEEVLAAPVEAVGEIPEAVLAPPMGEIPVEAPITEWIADPLPPAFLDDSPVYELSLDELGDDATIMASVNALIAPVIDELVAARCDTPSASTSASASASASAREESRASYGETSPKPPAGGEGGREESRAEPVVEPEAEPAGYLSQADLDLLYFARSAPPGPPPIDKLRAAPSNVEGPMPRDVATPPVASVDPLPEPERPEWIELIESLRLDVERLRAERGQPATAAVRSPQPRARIIPSSEPSPHRRSTSRSPKKTREAKPSHTLPRPIEDQWGLFDPEQCGFAALLSKLKEIEAHEAPPPA